MNTAGTVIIDKRSERPTIEESAVVIDFGSIK